MKNQLQKKFYAFIIMMLFSFAAANAQIVYTDVNPDKTKNTNAANYKIDLNNDGIKDFKIYVSITALTGSCTGHTNFAVSVTPLNSNSVAYIPSVRVLKLSANTIIDPNTGWSNSPSLILRTASRWIHHSGKCSSFAPLGAWSTSSDGYIGLKLNSAGNDFYGWARLSVTVNSTTASFTIKDYAYNSIPDQPILAGETSCATPTVNLTQSGSLSFCNGDSVTLTANGTGYQYQWKKGGVNITGAKSQTYVAKTAGTYKCKVTNSCGSITSTGKTVTVPCRLTNKVTEQLENPYELKIAPNPLSNSTTISFSLEQSEKVSFKIFDLNGRLVSTLADASFEEGDHEITWNAADVNAGIYFLKIQTGENLQTEKLIVTK